MNGISVIINEETLVVCKFKTLCEKRWSDLKRIEGEEKVRYCIDCMKPVFFCTTHEELRIHAKESHCITFVIDWKSNLLKFIILSPDNPHGNDRHEETHT